MVNSVGVSPNRALANFEHFVLVHPRNIRIGHFKPPKVKCETMHIKCTKPMPLHLRNEKSGNFDRFIAAIAKSKNLIQRLHMNVSSTD